MPKLLTEPQIAWFRDDGFLFPVNIFSAEEAAAMHGKIQAMEKAFGEEPQERFRVKAQLPFPWLCDLVSHPKLLDAAEDLIGPDIMCWGASFFAKKPHDPPYVSWHTDSFFYGYEPKETIAAWFSFNDSTPESGCVRYLSGSHKIAAVHDFKPGPENLIPAGQTVRGVDESKAVDAVLRAGQVVFTTKAWCMARGRTGRIIRGLAFRSITARPTCAKTASTARRRRYCGARIPTVTGCRIPNRWKIMAPIASSGCWTRAKNSSTLQTKK